MYPTKRPLDLAISISASVLLLPVWIILLLLVLILDRHCPVFRQERCGLDGEPFNLLKIKSMRANTATRFGTFIRKTSLDETLQFINVIKGEMSVVGPRPEICTNVDIYGGLFLDYDKRHEVKPGITGSYQLYANRKRMPICLRVDLDNEYVRTASLLRDLRIMRKTPRAMLNGE